MIVIDFNQTAISNIMMEIGNRTDVEINVPLIRHMIINSIRSYKTKFGKDFGDLVIACDNRNYWRKQVFPYYKAGRKKAREDSGYDWKLIFDTLATIRAELHAVFPYKVVDVDGAEADDVIAVLAEWSQTNDLANASPFAEGDPKPFLIISGDHDFIQLQKYKNVKQFSSIQKKYVKADTTPERYVLEHTIRGDKGDGVPNVLSGDDSIIAGERQKPISSKKLSEWLDNPASMPSDPDFVKRYERNKTMVDFTRIPSEVKDAIINNFVNQPNKDKSQLLNYFIMNKMKNMMDVIGDF